MSIFDLLKRKPKSYAGPALPATDLAIEDVQRAAMAPRVAPSFAETKRAPQKLSILDTIGTQSAPTSSKGSTVLSTKPAAAPKAAEKPDPFKDNFAELQGLIDDKTLASGNVRRISEAVLAAQRTIAEEKYDPIDKNSSWLKRFFEPAKQAIQTPGETLITQAQNIANIGLEPMGMVSQPLTRKGQLEALDRFLEKYDPERLVESKLIRSQAGQQSMPEGAAAFTTNIGTAVVGSTAAIGAFRSLPVAAKLKGAGEAGIYATHLIENLIASAVASTPGSIGQKKPKDFGKLMITNGGFLFPTATYGGLAIATTASFLGNIAMGQNPWEAAGNSALGLAGAAVQRKDLLNDLYTYRKGSFTEALRGLTMSQMSKDVPDVIKHAAVDEAAQLRAYYEQNPQDLDGLYKMTMDSQKRMIKLYAKHKTASPTGERRLIGKGGPMQDGPDGGFPQPSGDGDNIPLSQFNEAEPALPSIFKGPTADSPIPITPKISPSPSGSPLARTQPERPSDTGGDPNVVPRATTEPQPGIVEQVTKPIKLPEARRIAVDLYRQLDSESNPAFQSRAEFGEEFVAAEQNAGLAQELVTNAQTRGVLQQVTGKQGYEALEKVELDNMGPFIKSLRDRVQNGTPEARALDDIQARIRDDSDSEYGREVLNQLISKARGEIRKPARPNEEEILAVLDKAIADGRLQLSDEAGGGRTVEQVYERLYNELAQKADANKLPSAQEQSKQNVLGYGTKGLAKNAAKREALGDVLRREDSAKKLSPQQIRDAAAEANLSNKELEAIYKNDEAFDSQLEESRKLTQIEYNKTVAEAKQLPPEVSKKIIADLDRLKASGKIATPLEARLQKNKFLTKLLTQQKGITRAAQREAVRAKKDANHEKMKSLYKTVPRMPINIQRMMKALHEGYRKTMPLAQQEQIVRQMKDLNEIGAQQNRLFKEKREAADEALAKEVLKTAVRKVKNRDKRVRDRAGPLLMNETPPNLVIMDMGEGAMNVFKRSMDDGMNQAWPMQRDWDREVLAKAQEIGIKNEDMKNIVIYSLWNRGGRAGELAQARLKNMGLVDPRDPPKLDAKQKQFYEWQQKFLKMLAAKTKEVFEKENPLRELDISDPNYFPMKVAGNDFTVSKGPNTMSIDQVPDGFTKNIKGNEELDIYTEPDALFRHVNDVAHYVALTERMQQMRRILGRPEIIAGLGNENVDYLQNRWLDMVARHGTYAEKVNEAMAMINSMGNRAYGGVLAGKAIVGLRQFGSVIDALGPLLQKFGPGPTASYLTKVIKNAPALASEHLTALGSYIETNPDLQASVGITDLVMEQVKGGEFSSRHTFLERHPKLNKFIFAVIRQPDLLGRATLAMHVEGLYKAQGMEQPEAQRAAMEMVNNVFGSIRVHNRPTASGHANTRPLYLFGQTQRARQGMYRQAMKDWKKDPLGNSAVLGAYTLSSMILMYLGSLVIENDANREKAEKQAIQWGWFYSAIENTIPIIGPMISRTLQTGDGSNAIPYLGMVMNALGSYRQVLTGKKTETKVKGAMRGTEQTLGAIGIPAPAIRSNYNLIMNMYEKITGGSSVESILDPEVKEQIDTMKKNIQKELKNSNIEEMKKDLRRELQKVR